jgi:hypothetical protein
MENKKFTSMSKKTMIYSSSTNNTNNHIEKKIITNSSSNNKSSKDEVYISYNDSKKPEHKSIYGIRYNKDNLWNVVEKNNSDIKKYSKPANEFQHWFTHNQIPPLRLQYRDLESNFK